MGRLIKQINFPTDLRKFKKDDLKQISQELRDELIDVVSETGGHLGAGLGVVELTIALHYVFDTPKDKLVWDVSHQCYPHKIITGRRDKIKTLRKGGGLSGFTKRTESEYDPFGAAHSSTSISSTLGMAWAIETKMAALSLGWAIRSVSHQHLRNSSLERIDDRPVSEEVATVDKALTSGNRSVSRVGMLPSFSKTTCWIFCSLRF